MWKGTEKVFFVGICGISLSALALVLKNQGHKVWGSDLHPGEMGKKLAREGIEVFEGHNKNHLKDADVLVYTSAISVDNEELEEANKRKIRVVSRAQLLGELSSHYPKTIAVSGCHGKTTTTGMLATIFIDAGLDPTVHIGGNFSKIGGNVRIGGGPYFITEACEYKDSFLRLTPHTSAILGVQADHLDYFKNVNNVQASFNQFATNTKHFLVADFDNKRAVEASKHANCNIACYSRTKRADYAAKNICAMRNGCFEFDLFVCGLFARHIQLSAPGEHNISNALAAIAIARNENIDYQTITDALKEFSGVERRFELCGKINGAKVYHDYAHHPTEIAAAIKTARQVSGGKLWVVFQPHTFSRTKSFFCAFANSLSKADEVITYQIYPAREQPIKGITSEALAQKISSRGTQACCINSFTKILGTLKQQVRKTDLVLILGAGDIVELTKLI